MKTYMYILPIGGTVIGGDLNEDLYVHTANRRNSYRRNSYIVDCINECTM
jgi:hypothetical protein